MKVKDASICAWRSTSIGPSTDTSAVSFCREMKSLSRGGVTLRTACGRTTKRLVCQDDSPSERAAMRWLGCTESMPARKTSAT